PEAKKSTIKKHERSGFMLATQYIRIRNCNYERITLEDKPDERRYQYCIIARGGIKGLLSCSLRHLDGNTYLYYDISSKQNVSALYKDRKIDREWVKSFLWSMQQVSQELSRFLLDDRNLLWYPEHIYQDFIHKDYAFVYVPYFEKDTGFMKLIEYLVEHMDYEDAVLVDYVYRIYNQYQMLGSVYLEEQIFEDAKALDQHETAVHPSTISDLSVAVEKPVQSFSNDENQHASKTPDQQESAKKSKKKFLSIIKENYRKRMKESEEPIDYETHNTMLQYAVCDETVNSEEYGKTVYLDEDHELSSIPILYDKNSGEIYPLHKESLTIGKLKEVVDICLPDASLSRIHAKIKCENGKWFVEDQNSTNGTFKNGLRLQPYEKRTLECGDEVKVGGRSFLFR
ncbi:MAG: FHA domain-containing protein, partial [Lachnospiraceae bacterium]|nr:FHA domain-containing protein [Lachnospiraceae bacterium]